MKLKLLALLPLSLLILTTAGAQIKRTGPLPPPSKARKAKSSPDSTTDKTFYPRSTTYFGIGAGLDYGGLAGCKLEFLPFPELGLFAGAGFNFNGIGYNLGASIKFSPNHAARPILTGMYGYNAVLIQKGLNDQVVDKKTYYGVSVGAGGEFDTGERRQNKISVMVIYPFRSRAFQEDANRMNVSLLPIGLSFGMNLGF